VAADVLARIRREAASGDAHTEALLRDLERLRGGAAVREPPRERQPMVIPVEIRAGAGLLRFFTTITTLGAAQDVTLAELRIEAFHPADAETESAVRSMAG
jgi:hypothetical protein